uniref:Uncharacterized protein n=1 Tax=Quercus lobata TaxID=97700 RepID=A0A7N2ML14_QUELO
MIMVRTRFGKMPLKDLTMERKRVEEFEETLIYATHFSEAISVGVLWGKRDHVGALSELIKLAFLLEFNEEAVMFLMKSKNLQVIKDKMFLASAFPSD